MTTPDPWLARPSEPAFRQPQPSDQAPLFPQDEYPPDNYPPPGYLTQPYPEAGHTPAGYAQPRYPQPGYPQPVYVQPVYAQSVYVQPLYAQPTSYAPFGVHPVNGQPLSDKSKVTAGLLSLFLGYFGAGRFYAGNSGLGVAQLLINIVLTLITFGLWLSVAWIWPLIDGIVLLTGSPRDGLGRLLR